MAKAPESPAASPPVKKNLTGWFVLGFVALLAVVGGAAIPLLMSRTKANSTATSDTRHATNLKPALVPFGDVVVNLAEARATRYLKVKLTLVVDETQERTLDELLQKQKPFLRSWLISHLSDRTLEEVIGKAAQNRLRREIRDEFNARLFPDGGEIISDVLFEEFVVQ